MYYLIFDNKKEAISRTGSGDHLRECCDPPPIPVAWYIEQ